MGYMKEIHGDIVENTFKETSSEGSAIKIDVIVTQCNLFGLYGGDLWKHIEYKWPFIRGDIFRAYEEYVKRFNLKSWDRIPPGQMLPISLENLGFDENDNVIYGRKLCCLFTPLLITQDNYKGWEDALALLKVYANRILEKDKTIGFPVMIGCGQNGGNWPFIRKSIYDFSRSVKNPVYMVNHIDSITTHLLNRPANLQEVTRASDVILQRS